jgi:hypothetical protein
LEPAFATTPTQNQMAGVAQPSQACNTSMQQKHVSPTTGSSQRTVPPGRAPPTQQCAQRPARRQRVPAAAPRLSACQPQLRDPAERWTLWGRSWAGGWCPGKGFNQEGARFGKVGWPRRRQLCQNMYARDRMQHLLLPILLIIEVHIVSVELLAVFLAARMGCHLKALAWPAGGRWWCRRCCQRARNDRSCNARQHIAIVKRCDSKQPTLCSTYPPAESCVECRVLWRCGKVLALLLCAVMVTIVRRKSHSDNNGSSKPQLQCPRVSSTLKLRAERQDMIKPRPRLRCALCHPAAVATAALPCRLSQEGLGCAGAFSRQVAGVDSCVGPAQQRCKA